MNDIGASIRHYREINDLTQKELADKLSISPSTIGMYEQNRRIPDIATLTNMAKIFDIPLDVLVGTNQHTSLSKDKTEHHGFFFFFFDRELKNTFIERLNQTIADKNMSADDLCDIVSFDSDKCKEYLTGESEPSIEDLIELSQTLDVSLDFLLGQTEQLSPTEKKLLSTFECLNEDNQDIIIGKMKELLREQRLSDNNLKKASGK